LDLQYKYIYANGFLLARYDSSPADTHYYHHDGLGSIMGLTNESGNVEQSYFYDEFGNSLASYGSVSNHYLYTGQEYDGSITGLYNLRARYYDMSIGRFVSEDPITKIGLSDCLTHAYESSPSLWADQPQRINAFIYVANNPMNWIDPGGLFMFRSPKIPLSVCDLYLLCMRKTSESYNRYLSFCVRRYQDCLLKRKCNQDRSKLCANRLINCIENALSAYNLMRWHCWSVWWFGCKMEEAYVPGIS